MRLCDIHTHLLPGIDDGSDSWDTTMEMIRMSWECGVRVIIATPHRLPWENTYSAAEVPRLCREAERRSVEELKIPISILPGQELYYHHDTLRDLTDGTALPLAGSSCVLIEFAEDVPWEDVRQAVDTLSRGGYIPVIAHVERFGCLRLKDRIREIRERGALLQSNIHAVMHAGRFSADRRWLTRQYREERIDFLASDMHNLSLRSPIRTEDLGWFQQHLPEPYLKRLTYENARKWLALEQVSPEGSGT